MSPPQGTQRPHQDILWPDQTALSVCWPRLSAQNGETDFLTCYHSHLSLSAAAEDSLTHNLIILLFIEMKPRWEVGEPEAKGSYLEEQKSLGLGQYE